MHQLPLTNGHNPLWSVVEKGRCLSHVGQGFLRKKKGYSSKTICHKPLWRVVEKGRCLSHMGQGFLGEKKGYSSKTICHKAF
jgi:hypothetical protein